MSERKQLTKEQQQALQTVGALSGFAAAVPFGTGLPFQNLLKDTDELKIKKQEAMRMFPQADPNIFDYNRGGVLAGKTLVPTIPLDQNIATGRIFNQNISNRSLLNPKNLYRGEQSFPTYLSSQPGVPSPELGSYAQAIGNKTIFPEGDIQAITVTPSPGASRFAKDYAEVLADKLGKAHIQYEQFVAPWGPFHSNKNPETVKEAERLERKIETLGNKTPGTAGYVWGNVEKPQYSYAEGNWGLGQKEAGSNPAIYLSRINADPSKEAKYLYTGDILSLPYKEPRVRLKQYEDLGPATGPSWGISEANQDISFRKDLIGARGELTVGDLQSLLAERNLPFAYQSYTKLPDRTIGKPGGVQALVTGQTNPTQKPGNILRENLQKLADAEGISTAQAAERFARLVPNVGEPLTPSTPAVTGRTGEFPVQGQVASPFGGFASKTDLRQIGILPTADKASYKAFNVDEVDKLFKYVYPRYNASNAQLLDTYSIPIDPLDPFGEVEEGLSELIISRDKLRPQAANKLLNRTVGNLIEQSKPIKGLGLGGFAAGGIATAMDPAVIDALSQGNYQQAGTTAALNTAIGSAVGGATAKGLQALQAAGYARPAAAIGSGLPLAGGLLAGQGLVETGKALNRAYKSRTGKDFVTRNQVPISYPASPSTTPAIKPRMGTAILNGKPVQVPYGSVAGTRKVGRPWWDVVGSKFEDALNRFNAGSIIGR
jgi:hypothetical protein